MALRRYKISNDNIELYGKIQIEGLEGKNELLIPTDFEPQVAIVSSSKPYLRNPYWFGNNEKIKLYTLLPINPIMQNDSLITKYFFISSITGEQIEINAYGDGLVFINNKLQNQYNGFSKSLSKNAWQFSGNSINKFNQIDINTYIDNISYNLYLIYSEDETIYGNVCYFLQKNSNLPENYPNLFMITELNNEKYENNSLYYLGNMNFFEQKINLVEPMIFVIKNNEYILLEPSKYTFYIEDNNIYLLFNKPLSIEEENNIIILFIQADIPSLNIKYPNGMHKNGVILECNNYPYSRIDINYRIL